MSTSNESNNGFLKSFNLSHIIRSIPEDKKTGTDFTNFYERMHFAFNGYVRKTNAKQIRAVKAQIKEDYTKAMKRLKEMEQEIKDAE